LVIGNWFPAYRMQGFGLAGPKTLPLSGLRLAGLRYIPAISMAVSIIADMAEMFNENKTIFIK